MKRITTIITLLMLVCMGAGADGTWNITSNDLTTDGWVDMSGSVPSGVTSLGSYTPWSRTENITVTQPGILTVTFRYTSGQDQLVMLGVDLLDGNDNVVASDYHKGISGSGQDANNYLVTAASTGSYKLRYIIHKDGNLDSSQGTITVSKIIYADSYANITQWYKLRMNSNQTHYLKTDGSALSFTDAPDETNNYLWAFVGNPTDGFQIYSYNYGSTKAIDNSTPCGFTSSGTSNAIKLSGGRSGSTTSTKFCVSMKNDGNYYNYQSGAIKRYSSNDEGSAVILEEATPVSLVEGSTEEAPIYYAWRVAVGNNPAYMYTENGAANCPNNTAPSSFTDPIDAKYAWQFVGNAASGFAIKNKATGTYLGGRTASGGAMSMETSATCYFIPIYNSETNNKWYCKNYNYYIDRAINAPYAYTAGNNNDYIRLYDVKFSLSNAAAGLVVGSTTISDFTASYLITKTAELSCKTSGYVITTYDGYTTLVEALENDTDGTIYLTVLSSVSVTYNMMFNGNQITSTVVEEAIGSTASTPSAWTVPSYCSFTCPATEITATPSPIEVTLNWNGPFSISQDFNNANWYLLRMKNNAKNIKYQEGAGPYPLEDVANYNIEAEDYYSWAFVGNPYDGFTIYNKQAGSAMKLYEGANVSNGGIPLMSNENESKWTITRGTADSNFGISPKGKNFYFNAWSGGATVQYYNSGPGSDAGSQVTVLSVNDVDFTSMVTKFIQPYIDDPSDNYFAISSNAANTLKTTHAGGGSQTSWTKDQYKAYSEALKAAIKYPESGYYRIKSSNNEYLNAKANTQLTYDGTGSEASTIVYLSGSDNVFSAQMQGSYIRPSSNGAAVSLDANTYNLNFTSPVVNGAIVPGCVNIGTEATATSYLVRGTSPNVNSLNPNNNATAAQWIVEEATTFNVTLNGPVDGSYYATLCVPFDVTITGANAYTLKRDGSNLEPKQLTENKVPAGTAVLLVGATTAATATINTGAAFTTDNTNSLSGTYLQKQFDLVSGATAEYFLGSNDAGTKVGFYHSGFEDPENSGKYTLSANRAYLSNGSEARGYAINWSDASSVQDMKAAEDVNSAVVYDLQGRRVENPQHGMYIRNGRVIVVK